LCFYALFPLLVILSQKSKHGLSILLFLSAAIFIYFSFIELDSSVPLTEQWATYVNPLNQVFLFISGFAIGYFYNHPVNSKVVVAGLLLSIFVFVFLPASGDSIHLVTGYTRVVLTACCWVICFCAYKNTLSVPKFIGGVLSKIGESSYSLYLLHPITHSLLIGLLTYSDQYFYTPFSVKILFSFVATIFISYLNYTWFESYFQSLGKTLSERVSFQKSATRS
jgi:exopolysaccharide production protein ExoZ